MARMVLTKEAGLVRRAFAIFKASQTKGFPALSDEQSPFAYDRAVVWAGGHSFDQKGLS